MNDQQAPRNGKRWRGSPVHPSSNERKLEKEKEKHSKKKEVIATRFWNSQMVLLLEECNTFTSLLDILPNSIPWAHQKGKEFKTLLADHPREIRHWSTLLLPAQTHPLFRKV
jgi:hypothetical protein